jgi:hypothetical protein
MAPENPVAGQDRRREEWRKRHRAEERQQAIVNLRASTKNALADDFTAMATGWRVSREAHAFPETVAGAVPRGGQLRRPDGLGPKLRRATRRLDAARSNRQPARSAAVPRVRRPTLTVPSPRSDERTFGTAVRKKGESNRMADNSHSCPPLTVERDTRSAPAGSVRSKSFFTLVNQQPARVRIKCIKGLQNGGQRNQPWQVRDQGHS